MESTGGGLQWLSSFGDLGVPIRRGKRGSLVAVSIAGRTLNQALTMSYNPAKILLNSISLLHPSAPCA